MWVSGGSDIEKEKKSENLQWWKVSFSHASPQYTLLFSHSTMSFPAHPSLTPQASFHISCVSIGLGHLILLIRDKEVIVLHCEWRWDSCWHTKLNSILCFHGAVILYLVMWLYTDIIIILALPWSKLIFICQPAYLTTVYLCSYGKFKGLKVFWNTCNV